MPKTARGSSKKNNFVHYSFPYVKFHGNSYPLIPIGLKRGKKKVNTFALLDSGASYSVFRPEIAEALGLNRKKKKVLHLGTPNGGVDISLSKVEVSVEKTKFFTSIGFSKGYAANFNILGRKGFFNRFSVCFNEIMKTVVMVPLNRLQK